MMSLLDDDDSMYLVGTSQHGILLPILAYLFSFLFSIILPTLPPKVPRYSIPPPGRRHGLQLSSNNMRLPNLYLTSPTVLTNFEADKVEQAVR